MTPRCARARAYPARLRSSLPPSSNSDFDAEGDLYKKAGALVRFLGDWRGRAPTLAGRMEELYIALYEREYIELDDVRLAQNWLEALETAGYDLPPVHAGR